MSKVLFVISLMLLGTLPLSSTAHAESLEYSRLMILDLDEMRTSVKEKLDEAQMHLDEDTTEDAQGSLREAIKLILSRPNSDNMVSQLMPDVRGKHREAGGFEESLDEIVTTAIEALTKGKEPASRKSTNVFVLENFMSEFKPDAISNPKIKSVFEKIRDAKIKIPKDVAKDLKLRSMRQVNSSPSAVAEKIIGKAPKK
jgi:hypothetical protein